MKLIAYISTFLLFAGLLGAENYEYISASSPLSASSQSVPKFTVQVIAHPKLGKILTDGKGMTLYIFTPDKQSLSTCYEECAFTWPPLLISSGTPTLATGVVGTLDTTIRKDNSTQVTYNGMPLYYYVKDKKPGDVNGQNIDNKWFVVKPESHAY